MRTDLSKLKKAVESTGNVFIYPSDIDYSKVVPVVYTPEQRELAEKDDREYHKKLTEYYINNPE